MSRLLLQRGSLGAALTERSRHALACGAMQPIQTVEAIVPDTGMDFLVRRLSSLERKLEAKQAAKPGNPFLPHEPDLFVADVSDSHFALLNKFNVIERHLLIVTRAFVHQETLLDSADFQALAACMSEVDGLAFYNGGAIAGASEPHKHLQLVPLPLLKQGPPVPVERLFAAVRGRHGVVRVAGLPFRHAFAWMEEDWFTDLHRAAAPLHERYRELYAAVGLDRVNVGAEQRQSAPYNLLATRRWMLLVPRAHENFESISVNSLGFAGSLFVRNEAQMQLLIQTGPMAVLSAVAVNRSG